MAEKSTHSSVTRHDDLLSSPPRLAPPAGPGGKERRQPSITPRKFRRFFTPRARVSVAPSAARRALRDLTARALNRGPFSLDTSLPGVDNDDYMLPSPRSAKRRKTGHQTPETSPMKPSGTPLIQVTTPEPKSTAAATAVRPMLLSPMASSPVTCMDEHMSDIDELDGCPDSDSELPGYPHPLRQIIPSMQHGISGQLLQRELGTMRGLERRTLPRPVADWRIETADFCSTKDDYHVCTSHETPTGRCIPFCVSACHTNSLIAVGDEEGRIRLLDSASECESGFDNIFMSFAAHGNAVIDLDFSEDDRLLATASGDQTGKVVDMMTQTISSVLDHHTASLKQVRFQPGSGAGNVLATSGRDGSIKIWDLRCKGGPAQDFAIERTGFHYGPDRPIRQGCVVNSIYNAHARTRQMLQREEGTADIVTRYEVPGRIGEVSVTAIQFLPAGKEHLILSACEADSSIKLWDIRNVHTSRHKMSSPISVAAPPESHSMWRPFGISSMSLSTDGHRLYALSKDSTVYAYSTAHLVLGHAPELSFRDQPPKKKHGTAQAGLGPLYGFRHESLHATSFYVKTAVRPARDGRSELLAVGSSDACAVLFPTDERYFTDPDTHMLVGSAGDSASRADAWSTSTPIFSSFPAATSRDEPRRPGLFRTDSITSLNGGRMASNLPMVRSGTPLIRGHENKEVGSVCWTNEGSLISVCDDFRVRCWREDRNRAAELRAGEGGGRRWASGWADVGNDWDEDE